MFNMDIDFNEGLFPMDTGLTSMNNADTLSPHSYNPPSNLQTIFETGHTHFPSSFNQPHDVQSPQSYLSMPQSPMNIASPGYQSSSFSTTGFDTSSFDTRRQAPMGSLPAASALTQRLKSNPHAMPSSPIVNHSASPMLNYDNNLTRQLSVSASMPHYSPMNNKFGFPFNQDQVLSQQLDINDFGIKAVENQDLWSMSPATSSDTRPVQIPNGTGAHRRTGSFASSVSNGSGARHGPYRRTLSLALSSLSHGTPELYMSSPSVPMVTMLTPSSVTSELSPVPTSAGFTPEQIPAAQAIVQFIAEHPGVKIPANLITRELVEVSEGKGKGYCLIGNCGQIRAAQRADPNYDPSTDKEYRKRIDHLQDHVKDKHFNSRPFVCSHSTCFVSFAREADLKRHSEIHNNLKVVCPDQTCGKSYTRPDNLGRHIKQKHPSLAVAQSLPTHSHVRHSTTPY